MVIGVDAGATTTRCVLATLGGVVVGRGTAGGANRNSSAGKVAETLWTALTEALGKTDRAAVGLGMLGGAGSSGAGREAFRTAAQRAWQDAGLRGEVVTVTDLEVAYAAGTAAPDGVLLLSGTGALAARFSGGELRKRCDGYGWLLGDEGSAVWIGVRALRAVLAALDGRGEPTSLVEAARRHFHVAASLPAEDTAQALLAAAFAVAPAELGRLAPTISAAADEEKDPIAVRICAAAADRLLHTFDSVQPPPGAVPVLAGSVLLNDGPVSRAVRAGLLARTGTEPRPARDGAAGAAALAIARVTGAPVSPVVHSRLTGSLVPTSAETPTPPPGIG
ncbi:N-acetylglucosamine kinase [Actinoplanes sp. L3-i22]|nr:N-acetylglucosamine kinase [Actinoplanes sp. L3-i22]